MKKLFFTTGILVALASPSFAGGSFDGLYAGIDGAYNRSKSMGRKDDSFSPNIYMGYGQTKDKIYFGAEGNLDFSGVNMTVDGRKFKKDIGYGITGKIGYEFSRNYLGYGLVGYERADIKVGGRKEGFDGIRYGAGVERKIKKNISARSEISYSTLKNDGVKVKNLRTTVGVAMRF